MTSDPMHGSFILQGARVAVLGYDSDARDYALALLDAGNAVAIGVDPEGPCAARARGDGFGVDHPVAVVGDAEVVVVLVREPGALWSQCEPYVAPGALVVFARALALEAGACTRGGFDIALVTADDLHTGCRIAIHRDATGQALVRAMGYARAACADEDVPLRETTVMTEADLELASIGERAGSLLAFAASSERLPPRPAPKRQAVVVDDEEEPVTDERDWMALTWRGPV